MYCTTEAHLESGLEHVKRERKCRSSEASNSGGAHLYRQAWMLRISLLENLLGKCAHQRQERQEAEKITPESPYTSPSYEPRMLKWSKTFEGLQIIVTGHLYNDNRSRPCNVSAFVEKLTKSHWYDSVRYAKRGHLQMSP